LSIIHRRSNVAGYMESRASHVCVMTSCERGRLRAPSMAGSETGWRAPCCECCCKQSEPLSELDAKLLAMVRAVTAAGNEAEILKNLDDFMSGRNTGRVANGEAGSKPSGDRPPSQRQQNQQGEGEGEDLNADKASPLSRFSKPSDSSTIIKDFRIWQASK